MAFTKGQKAYVHSRDAGNRDYETTVVSIGKKYISCQQFPNCPKQRFSIEDKIDVDWCNWVLFESKEAFLEKAELEKSVRNLREKLMFKLHYLSKDQVDRIIDILNEI